MHVCMCVCVCVCMCVCVYVCVCVWGGGGGGVHVHGAKCIQTIAISQPSSVGSRNTFVFPV